MSRYRLEIWFKEYTDAERILKALRRERDPNMGLVCWGREQAGIVIYHDAFSTHIVDLQKQIESKAVELGIWDEESIRDRRKEDRKVSKIDEEIRE